MRVIEKAIRVRIAQTPDATLAEVYFTSPEWGPMAPPDVTIRHGVAKRHHTDRDDPALGEALAMVRALQGVVDDLWVNVKAACPDIVTPKERAAAKGYAKGVMDGVRQATTGAGRAPARCRWGRGPRDPGI